MEAYLDNSATTQCSQEAADLMMRLLRVDYGNPSSLHNRGMEAENYVKEARKRIAQTLKVNEKEIYFTSGGSESNNLAIVGSALANKRSGMHVITTAIEHPSVANPFAYLEEQGFAVTYLPVDAYGCISLQDLKDAMCSDTILVSIMHVNNEIGAVQPVEEAARLIKQTIKLSLSCGCHPVLWQIPHLSEAHGNRSFIRQWAQDPRTKGQRIFICKR